MSYKYYDEYAVGPRRHGALHHSVRSLAPSHSHLDPYRTTCFYRPQPGREVSPSLRRVRTKHSLPAVPGPLRGSWPLASIRTAWTDRMLVPDSSHNLFDSYLREKAEVGGAPYQKDEQVEEATGKDGETEQNNPSELAGDNGQPV